MRLLSFSFSAKPSPAAAAAAHAVGAAHDLADQSVDVAGARQVVAVAAVVAEDEVAGDQRVGDGDAGPLLADAGVHRAEELPLREQLEQPLLGLPDEKCLGPQLQ
jgi:hypothetical protein